MRAALALGAQTRPGENRIGELCAEVAQQVANPSGGEDEG
jgi:hypothetical protein